MRLLILFLILLFPVLTVTIFITAEFNMNKKKWYKDLNKAMWLISILFVLVPVVYFIEALINPKQSSYFANMATIFSAIVTSLAFAVGLTVVSKYLLEKSEKSKKSLIDQIDDMTKEINEMTEQQKREREERSKWLDK